LTYWIIDRMLPGLIPSLIMAALVRVSHIRLKRHITATADRQAGDLLQARSAAEATLGAVQTLAVTRRTPG
jgi:hypothetical protein